MRVWEESCRAHKGDHRTLESVSCLCRRRGQRGEGDFICSTAPTDSARRCSAGARPILLRLPVAGEIIRKNMQAQCCKLLDLLCAAGVPLLAGVGMLREVIGFHPYRKSFDEIERRLEPGRAFAETLARFPDLYDRKLTALVRVGEQTNRLPEMLRRQGEILTEELEYAIRRMGAMLEPALILLVGILVAVILIAMYMPMFSLGGIMG